MKCKLTEKKNMTLMLMAGIAMLVIGAGAAYMLPDEAHTATRLAGMLSGMGMAFAAMGGGVLIWRRHVGETKAKDSEMAMLDERGQMIAYKAQSVLALAATASLVVMIVTALVRGDMLYMLLGAGLCMFCAAAKYMAMHIYSKRM